MKNNLLELVPICERDIDCFDGTEYGNLSAEKRVELINNSVKCCYDGKFFRFFLLKLGSEVVGFMNVCAHSKSAISVAPEIKEQYRRKGYGEKGLLLTLSKVKDLGYKVAIATVREENVASIKLHEKLNFEYVFSYVKKEKTLRTYIKIL